MRECEIFLSTKVSWALDLFYMQMQEGKRKDKKRGNSEVSDGRRKEKCEFKGKLSSGLFCLIACCKF